MSKDFGRMMTFMEEVLARNQGLGVRSLEIFHWIDILSNSVVTRLLTFLKGYEEMGYNLEAVKMDKADPRTGRLGFDRLLSKSRYGRSRNIDELCGEWCIPRMSFQSETLLAKFARWSEMLFHPSQKEPFRRGAALRVMSKEFDKFTILSRGIADFLCECASHELENAGCRTICFEGELGGALEVGPAEEAWRDIYPGFFQRFPNVARVELNGCWRSAPPIELLRVLSRNLGSKKNSIKFSGTGATRLPTLFFSKKNARFSIKLRDEESQIGQILLFGSEEIKFGQGGGGLSGRMGNLIISHGFSTLDLTDFSLLYRQGQDPPIEEYEKIASNLLSIKEFNPDSIWVLDVKGKVPRFGGEWEPLIWTKITNLRPSYAIFARYADDPIHKSIDNNPYITDIVKQLQGEPVWISLRRTYPELPRGGDRDDGPAKARIKDLLLPSRLGDPDARTAYLCELLKNLPGWNLKEMVVDIDFWRGRVCRDAFLEWLQNSTQLSFLTIIYNCEEDVENILDSLKDNECLMGLEIRKPPGGSLPLSSILGFKSLRPGLELTVKIGRRGIYLKGKLSIRKKYREMLFYNFPWIKAEHVGHWDDFPPLPY